MIDDALELATDSMQKAQAHLVVELGRVRTGRANPKLLEDVRVESYGVMMTMNQVATISAADARMLVVKPFDRGTLSDIERAIGAANLGLNPSNDGAVVRVPIPALTADRRKQLVKQARDAGEAARVAIRGARRDANDLLKQAEKDKEISEDDLKRALDKVQALTDDWVKKIDAAVTAKESEITED